MNNEAKNDEAVEMEQSELESGRAQGCNRKFLRKAQADSQLAEQVNNTDSYQALAQLSERLGEPATASELRAAFSTRNASVLAQQMIRFRPWMRGPCGTGSPPWTSSPWSRSW